MSDQLLAAYKQVADKAADLQRDVTQALSDPDFRSVFAIATAHNYVYHIPDFRASLQALQLAQQALKRSQQEEAAKEGCQCQQAPSTPAEPLNQKSPSLIR